MESLNSASEDAADDAALQSSVSDQSDHADSCTLAGASCSTVDDNTSAADKSAMSVDPYGYVQRGDYTSEVYKLELMNLPKRFGIAVSRLYVIFTT